MNLSELSTVAKNKFDIIANTDGILAVLPYAEIKSEIRKNPHALYKILEIAARKSLEIFHYNIFGHEYNPLIKLTATQSQGKQVKDFFAKNAIIKAFFKGFDRKDEKIMMNYFKTSEVEMGERLIRKDTRDRCVIFVVSGKFIQFGNNSERDVEFREGAVIGVEEFLKNNEWTRDIICE